MSSCQPDRVSTTVLIGEWVGVDDGSGPTGRTREGPSDGFSSVHPDGTCDPVEP